MTEPPVARTALGALTGLWGDGVALFRGVPYALPPVGAWRFAPAQPVPAWSGIRDATRHGPIAPQLPARLVASMGNYSRAQGEDCLTLTIATPTPDAGRRAVMVWLHGGAFTTGAGSLDWYDGANLAREGDMVVVGVNYRIGALGFLCRDGVADGNLGIGDQAAALRWVRDHIAAFGGDPERVTLVGQSAGGGAIAALLLDREARDLFHRAVLQSPMLPQPPITYAEAAERGGRFLEILGMDPRKASVAQLLEAQGKFGRVWAGEGATWPPFAPNVPDAMTAAAFTDAIADAVAGKEILMGWTCQEFGAFFGADAAMMTLDADSAAARAKTTCGDAQAVAPYRRADKRPIDWLADFLCDNIFALPSQRFAAAVANRGGKVWSYRFDWSPVGSPFQACHCLDIPFIFGNWHRAWRDAPMLAGGNATEMTNLSRAMQRSWIEFVRSGDPGHDELPHWPPRDVAEDIYLRFDRAITTATRRIAPGTPIYNIV
ncbi:MAG TPA: carboxylesterase family protein [Stellaceae bacterium]|jgi:para-nitrobenzyl esterase|nr:carboxylesterase family protein [Stellaceae bacterium]